MVLRRGARTAPARGGKKKGRTPSPKGRGGKKKGRTPSPQRNAMAALDEKTPIVVTGVAGFIGLVLTVGGINGAAINTAHELGH